MVQIRNNELFDVLVGKVSGAINRTFLRAFSSENIDITTEQWTVLACLWQKDKVTQQTLCLLTTKDKPSMTRLIDKLERRSLVIRVPDQNDRRNNLIHLTEDGKELEQKATELVGKIVEKTLGNITDEELNICRIVLKKVMANLK